MKKNEVQERVLKNGKPLSWFKFKWDEKTNTFISNEDDLEIKFNGIDNCTFIVSKFCTFTTGHSCSFKTDGHCTFKTGSNCSFNTLGFCNFDTGSHCNFDAGELCGFDTGSHCTLFTKQCCTFNTHKDCIFNTGHSCNFKTLSNCTFTTRQGCTFHTFDDCTFNTGSHCTFNTEPNCNFITNGNCEFTTGQNCFFNTSQDCKFKAGKGSIFKIDGILFYSTDSTDSTGNKYIKESKMDHFNNMLEGADLTIGGIGNISKDNNGNIYIDNNGNIYIDNTIYNSKAQKDSNQTTDKNIEEESLYDLMHNFYESIFEPNYTNQTIGDKIMGARKKREIPENKLELWYDMGESKYVVVDDDYTIKHCETEPVPCNGKWWISVGNFNKLGIDHPLAQIAMETFLNHGWANSMIQKPEEAVKVWVPDFDEYYYKPHFEFINPCDKKNIRGVNTDNYNNRDTIQSCLAFKERKHAEWVAKYYLHPATLQAAIAIDGLATYEQMKGRDLTYSITTSYYIGPFTSNCRNREGIVTYRAETEFNPYVVNFSSKEKVEEAYKVILPNGKTLEQFLVDGFEEAMYND